MRKRILQPSCSTAVEVSAGVLRAIATVLLISLAAPSAAAAPAQDAGEEVPAIQDQGDFYILNFSEDAQTGMTLEQFVKSCQQATGLNFIIPPDSEAALKSQRVRMFGTKQIPKSEFYSFFQIILFINEFACVELGDGPTSVIVIQQLTGGQPRTNIKQGAVIVLPEDLDSYKTEPATLITTVVTLPNLDARNLVNSLRGLMTDNATQGMLPAGDSNSVILTGFGTNIWQIVQLLYLINDKSQPEDPILPVFDRVPLEFAAAEDAADIIEQLLEARQQAEQEIMNNARGGDNVAIQRRSSVSAKIIVDKRTSSLLIMSMPDELPAIKDLIARIDTKVLQPERNYHVYQLENVSAEDLAEKLTQFLEDSQSLVEDQTGTGGRATGAAASSSSNSEDVVVVEEPVTNSLLIAANKTRYQEVLELIRVLDRRADQVLIETALVELSGNNFTDIGVELGLAEIGASRGGFGITSFGLSTLQDLDGDGIPETRVPNITNGLTGGIIEADDFSLPFLLALLETKNQANVLNIPSILVNDNGAATVETIEERPTTTVTAFGGAGGGQTQENFNGYVEAGIKLSISPSISASRYLRLGIQLEVSNFSGLGSGSIPPPKITRNLNTTVNVPDGDTMVIGGVITNNNNFDRQQTPWLGDIPLIGALFRRDTRDESRRTLYFFVTPHILADDDFADLAELSYQKKLEASSVIGAERLRLVDPSFGVDDDDVPDLEAFELPLYSSPPAGETSPEAIGIDPLQQKELMEGSFEDGQAGAEAAEAQGYETSGGLTAEELEQLEALGYTSDPTDG